MAMGFSIVYNSTGILHVAQGAVYSISPFLLVSLIDAGFGLPASTAIVLLLAIFISLALELLNHWPLYKKDASLQSHFISSLGIYIAIIQIIAMVWGNETRVLKGAIAPAYSFWNVTITKPQALGGSLSLIAILCFTFWLCRTEGGVRFMALSDNPIQLSLMGYDISKLRLFAFGLSGFFTMLTALLTAIDVGFDPHSGLNMVFLGIVATIIGGKSSFAGPVIGGILLGIVRSQVVWHTSARWENMLTFLILVLFLFFRPQGIMGKKGGLGTL